MATYLNFHQLDRSPFEGDGSDQLVLATDSLRRAYAEIKSDLENESPRVCLSGGPGIGKSSLARALPKLLDSDAHCALIRTPGAGWSRVEASIAKQLAVDGGKLSRTRLIAARTDGRRLVIVIDQAENLDAGSLEQLDVLLGYRDDEGEQLVQCVLLANLEAAPRGQEIPLLWWLDQLTTRQLTLEPIPEVGLRRYIDKHLKKAGARNGSIFDDDAIIAIQRFTSGVPGAVSALCEQLLAKAAELERHTITAELVAQACGDAPALDVQAPQARTKPHSTHEPDPNPELPKLGERLPHGRSSRLADPGGFEEPELEIQQGLLPVDEDNYSQQTDFFADARQADEARQRPTPSHHVNQPSPGSGRGARMVRNLIVLAAGAVLAVGVHAWITSEMPQAAPKPPTRAQMTPPAATPDAILMMVPAADRHLVARSLALEEAQSRDDSDAPEGLTSDLRLDTSADNAAVLSASRGSATQVARPGASEDPPTLSLSELYEIAEKTGTEPRSAEPWSQQAPEGTPAAPAPYGQRTSRPQRQ